MLSSAEGWLRQYTSSISLQQSRLAWGSTQNCVRCLQALLKTSRHAELLLSCGLLCNLGMPQGSWGTCIAECVPRGDPRVKGFLHSYSCLELSGNAGSISCLFPLKLKACTARCVVSGRHSQLRLNTVIGTSLHHDKSSLPAAGADEWPAQPAPHAAYAAVPPREPPHQPHAGCLAAAGRALPFRCVEHFWGLVGMSKLVLSRRVPVPFWLAWPART